MRYILPILLLLLSNCTSFDSKKLTSSLDVLVGENINFAISKLGIPDGERNIAGYHVYRWGFSQNYNDVITTYSPTSGVIGNTTFTAGTYNTVPVTRNSNCYIEFSFGENGIINGHYWSGNNCQKYIDLLNK